MRLGFDRIYCISTDDDFATAERCVAANSLRSRIELFHFTDFHHGWQIGCYNAHLPLVEEDWVMLIDVYEFLYLGQFSDIHEYLATVGDDVGQIQFPWLLQLSSDYSADRVLEIARDSEGHMSDHVKSMVRREYTDGLGVHAHGVKGLKNCLSSGAEVPIAPRHRSLLGDPAFFADHPLVLHFASRGHLDMMNRIMDHRFFNAKSGQGERERLARFLLGSADWSNIPTRCLLMRFYAALPTTGRRIRVPPLDSRTDTQDLREIFLARLETLIDFEYRDLAEIEQRFERTYRFAMKLARLDPTSAVRLDKYLECATQEEYIERLRSSLTTP